MRKLKKKKLENISGQKGRRKRSFIRGVMSSELSKLFKPKNHHEFLAIESAAQRISNKLSSYEDLTEKRLKNSSYSDFFGPSLKDATYLAGLSSLWEFELRMLAKKLGVNVFKTYEETSSKGKKAKFVEFNDLEDVIDDLNKKTKNNLKLDLDTIRQVRNGLVHFNFNHTRKVFNIKRRDVPEKHKSSLVQVDIATGEAERISDIEDLGRMLEKDAYAWFIDVWQSGLPEDVKELILSSLEKIHFLINFHAQSFDERKGVMEKVFFDGIKPSSGEIDLYMNYFESVRVKTSVKEYSKTLLSCFIKMS